MECRKKLNGVQEETISPLVWDYPVQLLNISSYYYSFLAYSSYYLFILFSLLVN